jgi:hypothetical protein
MICAGGADDGASARPGLDAEGPLELEKSQRLAHGGTRHAEFLNHPVFGGELRPGSKPPAPDLAHEPAGDADGGAFGMSLSAHPVDASSLRSRWRLNN